MFLKLILLHFLLHESCLHRIYFTRLFFDLHQNYVGEWEQYCFLLQLLYSIRIIFTKALQAEVFEHQSLHNLDFFFKCIYIFDKFSKLVQLFFFFRMKVEGKLFKLCLLPIYLNFPKLLKKLTLTDFAYQVNGKQIFAKLEKR